MELLLGKKTMVLFFLFFITTISACSSLPEAMLPDSKNLEGIELYNARGDLVAGRSCKPRADGGKICTTVLPGGEKQIAEYGPGETLKPPVK